MCPSSPHEAIRTRRGTVSTVLNVHIVIKATPRAINFQQESHISHLRVTTEYTTNVKNIPDWCRHLYSSCGSAKHRYMVGLLYLISQCAKLHVTGWTWVVFTHIYLLFLWFLQRRSRILWIYPRIICGNIRPFCRASAVRFLIELCCICCD
jgi:hypothetical protein